MSWTYSGNPSSSPKDEVRFILADTDSADPLVSDEEINYGLDKINGSVDHTVYLAATAIASKFGRMATQSLGQSSENYTAQAAFYNRLASKYAKLSGMTVAWGGASTIKSDNTAFGVGMMNNNNNAR